jgi:signal transduction histidine kinase
MQVIATETHDQLVRGLSHHMNNILTLFNGYLGLILEDCRLDSSAQDGLARIQQGARSATDLLDRTNALVSNSSVMWQPIRLADLARQLRPAFENHRPQRSKLVFDISENLPAAWADSSRLRCILIELVKNACDATVGGGTVTVSATASGTGIVLRVHDTGIGITEEQMGEVFRPFFTTKRKPNTWGLGLTIAARAAQQLGTNFEVSSTPGNTTFEIRLALAEAANATESQSEATGSKTAGKQLADGKAA